ncbi:transcription factor Opi1-domain-containing protein [Blastocladiella britannica]|nr:transcription factor Opi1-domain-containing protein [Blastocladiella britannica]
MRRSRPYDSACSSVTDPVPDPSSVDLMMMDDTAAMDIPSSSSAAAAAPAAPPTPTSSLFFDRMSALPLVGSGVRSISTLYESTKQSSRVVNATASAIESYLLPPYTTPPDGATLPSAAAAATPPAAPQAHLPRLPELDAMPPALLEPPAHSAAFSAPRQRSRWQQVTAGAVAVAGAGAAVISEESLKSLRYCLEWLQYATHQLEAHIQSLRDFIAHALSSGLASITYPTDTVFRYGPSMLADIKRDIAETLRRVVDVVGRYAGNLLSGEARIRVRGFILSLPNRWAALQAATAAAQGSESSEAQQVMAFAADAGGILYSIQEVFGSSINTAQWVRGTLNRVPIVGSFVSHQPSLDSPVLAMHPPSSPALAHGMASMSLTPTAVPLGGGPAPVVEMISDHGMLPGSFHTHRHMEPPTRKRRNDQLHQQQQQQQQHHLHHHHHPFQHHHHGITGAAATAPLDVASEAAEPMDQSSEGDACELEAARKRKKCA